MKRKILSIVLTAAMLLSVFAAIPFGTLAASAANATFDSQEEKDYYSSERHLAGALTDTGDTSHGRAVNLSSIGGGWKGGSVMRVAQWSDNGTFEAYSFTAGTYSIDFDYKASITIDSADAEVKLYLLGVSEVNGMGGLFWAGDGSNANKWTNQIYNEVISKDTNGEWVHKTFTFTVSKETEIAIAPNTTSIWLAAADQQLLIDNLTVTEKTAPTSTIVDFEDEATREWLISKSAAQAAEADEAQGYAAKLTTLGLIGQVQLWPSCVHISAKDSDGNVDGFVAKAGATYELSFKVKIDTLPESDNIDNFYIVYGNGGNNWPMTTSSISDYSLKTALWKSCTDRNQWITLRANFTVPENIGTSTQMYLCPAISSTYKVTDQAVWIDDIRLSEISYRSTSVDFENTDEFYGADNANYTLTDYGGVELADTGDASHGKAIKITQLSATSSDWPQSFVVPTSDGGSVFHGECEATYRISFDVKKAKLDSNLQLYYVPCANASNLGKLWNVNYTTDYTGQKVKITEIAAGEGDWQRVTVDFTTAAKATKGPQYATFTIIPFSSVKTTDQEVYIDNIEIQRLTKITTHNGAEDGKVISALPETKLDTLGGSLLAGARVGQWYTDEALTKPASGKVGIYDRELWASFETVDGDFENGNTPAGCIWGSNETWQVLPYVGTDNSTAITNKNAANKNSNGVWPQAIWLLNSDGTIFHTVSGHEYSLEFDIKFENPSEISDWGSLGIAKSKPGYNSFESALYGYFDENDEYQYLNESIKYAFQDGNGGFATTGYYVHRSYTITAEDGNTPVIIVPRGITTPTYIDNIKLVDLTMQKKVTDTDGNVLAKGYIGETVKLPETDTANSDNFVYWAKESDLNTPVTELKLTADTSLTAVTSQLAVTEATADAESKTVSVKAVYDGLEYTETDDKLTLSAVEYNGKKRCISEIGILAASKADLNGKALTLETEGALKASNSDMKYSATADGKLFATAVIKTDKLNTEFAVTAYIKTSDGKVLYSKARVGLELSVAALTGLDTADEAAYTALDSKYSLVSNSEFNSKDVTSDVFGGWNIWGQKHTDDSGVTHYSNKSALSLNDGSLVMTATKTSDTEQTIPYLLSKYRFTNGYLEVKAKFSSNESASGCIWLNSAAVKSDRLKYSVTEKDKYVYPELDIAEFTSTDKIYTTLHSWGNITQSDGTTAYEDAGQIRLNPLSDSSANTLDLDVTEWHVYGFERTESAMRVYIDGTLTYEYTLETALANKKADKWPENKRTENEIKALFENETYLILSANASALETGEESVSYVDYVRFYK